MDCHLLSHGISVEKDSLHDCCLVRTSEYCGSPFIIKLNDDKTVDWNEVFELKKSLKEKKKNDPKACKGCRALTDEKDYNDGDYISYINLNHWNICNSRCIYCSDGYFGGDKYFNVYPLMKSLADKGYINNCGEVTFQGGEPTVLPEFEELLTLFLEQKINIRVHSSGIKYSKALDNGIKDGLVTVVISPDTGIKETYEKIKRVPCFDKVWANIETYAKNRKNPENVKAKFIITPGVNDSIEEIDKFIKKSLSVGLTNIIWEVEGRYAGLCNYDAPHVCMLIDYALDAAKKAGLNDEFYDGAMYCMKNRTLPKQEFSTKTELKKAYNLLKKKYKDKNPDYISFS